jgi:hypothetical protein
MNVVFNKKGEGSKPGNRRLHRVWKDVISSWPVFTAFVVWFVLLGALWVHKHFVSNERPSSEVVSEISELDIVREVANSFGVPAGPAVRLCLYLENGVFSGVGLFKVKQEHVSWLKDQFVPGAEVNLKDPVMNANIAFALISSLHDRGYSWEQSFLIYVHGWEQLAPSTRSSKSKAFLDFVFEDDLDE